MKHLENAIKSRSLEVFEHYIGSLYKSGSVEPGINISSPFILPEKQDTPSFNVFKSYGGHFIFNDYSSTSKQETDCVAFVMKMEKIRTRPQAIRFICHNILLIRRKK